jgi:uncharacterized protein (TIGR04255 family)
MPPSVMKESVTTSQEQQMRREYSNPPVHEVVLDLQFLVGIEDESVLRTLRGRLSDLFKVTEEQNMTGVLFSVGPAGHELQPQPRQFTGWLFKDEDATPRWLFKTLATQLTLHIVRSAKWPHGKYVGWETIFARFMKLYDLVKDAYQPLTIRRVGLRYLNRIAIPMDDDPSSWFRFGTSAPEFLKGVRAFSFRQTWENPGGEEDLGTTIGLTRIDIEDRELAADHQGVLLDIDVFNYWVKNAPTFAALPEWFTRAHSVENRIFESCISDRLRERFDEP